MEHTSNNEQIKQNQQIKQVKEASIAERKNQLRKKITLELKSLTEEYRKLQSQKILETVTSSKAFMEADCILSYSPLKIELDVSPINKRVLEENKMLALPRVLDDENMDFFVIGNMEELENKCCKGAYGILEPSTELNAFDLSLCSQKEIKKILVLVPALALSTSGLRLGKGKGYYDRYLANLSEKAIASGIQVILWGLGFRCQKEEDIPCSDHDLRLHMTSFTD